jgi:hypothetical protein
MFSRRTDWKLTPNRFTQVQRELQTKNVGIGTCEKIDFREETTIRSSVCPFFDPFSSPGLFCLRCLYFTLVLKRIVHRGLASGSSIAGMCEPLLITSAPSRFVRFG